MHPTLTMSPKFWTGGGESEEIIDMKEYHHNDELTSPKFARNARNLLNNVCRLAAIISRL